MYDKSNLDTHDRSISSLRTLRMPEDEDIFWFRDDLHQPYPICPLGMTTIQKHHAWGYHVGAEVTKLPPSKGGHVKIYKGRVMLGFEAITDPDEIAKGQPSSISSWSTQGPTGIPFTTAISMR